MMQRLALEVLLERSFTLRIVLQRDVPIWWSELVNVNDQAAT